MNTNVLLALSAVAIWVPVYIVYFIGVQRLKEMPKRWLIKRRKKREEAAKLAKRDIGPMT